GFLMPFVFLATAATRVGMYSMADLLSLYQVLHLFAEGILGMVLLLIFMQSIPLLTVKRYQPALKTEEVVCIIMLVASILTGIIGWVIYGVSLEQVLSRYIVLVFAIVGGEAIGSTDGVVTGIILSLANVINLFQMSLLSFSGLLGGLLQEGKKLGVSTGLLVGTFLVGIYGGFESLQSTMFASLSEIALFLATPNSHLKKLAKFIIGNTEYMYEVRK